MFRADERSGLFTSQAPSEIRNATDVSVSNVLLKTILRILSFSRVRRIMSAYNDDKIYSVDLVGAVGFSSSFLSFFKLTFFFVGTSSRSICFQDG